MLNKTPVQAVNLHVIAELPRLQFLDLTRNRIHSLYCTPGLAKTPMLAIVYLSYNKLRSINMNLFHAMDSLEMLDLSHNLISVMSGSLVSRSLSFLDLSHNKLLEFDSCQWSLPNIYNLVVNDNLLELLPRCIEQTFGNVSFIDFHNNRFRRDEMFRFGKLENLAYLTLDHNQLTYVTLDKSTIPSKMSYLSLSCNKLTHFAMSYVPSKDVFVDVTKNCIVSVDWNKVSTNLTKLTMEGNPAFICWTTLLQPSTALRFHCDPDFICELWNWNPREEGTFVLYHIPKAYRTLELHNLLASSASSKLFEIFETLRQDKEVTLRVQVSTLRTFVLENDAYYVVMDFEKTHLSSISFGRNSRLKLLMIKRSKLTQLPRTIDRLKALNRLTLSHSLIQAVNLNVIAELPNLMYLDLSRNKIHSLYFTAQKALIPNLVDVYLGYNMLRSINMNLFHTMTSLENIDLSHNLIGVVSGSLTASNLTFLDLSFNRLSTLDCCEWSIPNIQNLVADNNLFQLLP
uniref:Uncharacterized protein n=1 Tax=Anopheles maculatus TaxID=74869 RepID=A0A182S633_9DIPT